MAIRGTVNLGKLRMLVAVLGAISLLASFTAPSGAYVRPGGWVKQVDLLANGEQPPVDSCPGQSISGNGRVVAFASKSDGYVPGDTNLGCDIFVRDLSTGEIERVDVSSAGDQAMGPDVQVGTIVNFTLARNPSLSANGRYVAFISNALNLVPNDTNVSEDVFVHDRVKGTTERVSIASDGSQAEISTATATKLGSAGVGAPSLSDDGRFVAFQHPAQNLDPTKTYETSLTSVGTAQGYAFVRDRDRRTTELVSVATDQNVALPGFAPSISADGRYVSFSSQGDYGLESKPADFDIFVHDRTTHDTSLVSSDSAGGEGSTVGNAEQILIAGASSDHDSADKISSDGRYVVFTATYDNLVPNDSDRYHGASGLQDVFVKDLLTGRTERVSVSWAGEETTRYAAVEVSISDDGRYVAYSSVRSDINEVDIESGVDYVSGDPDESRDDTAYIYDRETGAVVIAARDASGRIASDNCSADREDGGGGVTEPRLSRGARTVLFSACANNLRTTDEGADPHWHYFVRFMGSAMGAALLEGPGPDRPAQDQNTICLSSDVCIPPLGTVVAADHSEDNPPFPGTNLTSVRVAYRPQYGDLFVMEELEDMPNLHIGTVGVFSSAASTSTLYGFRFEVGTRRFEARATSLLGGTFELFDCTAAPACTKVTDLQGGYGTTGERIVFALPLAEIGLASGGELSAIEAFTSLGASSTGAIKILDTVKIQP